jgi:hypothetical protein
MKYILALLMLWAEPCLAQFSVELEAPDSAKPGDLVVLDASVIPSGSRSWSVLNAPPGSYRVVDDGERLVFATSSPGIYYFVFAFTEEPEVSAEELSVAQLNLLKLINQDPLVKEELESAYEALSIIIRILVNQKLETRTVSHTLTIEGTPNPNPNPGPGPNPGPIPLPDGKYKLAQLSRNEATKYGQKDAFAEVATVHRAIAAQIQAGVLKGPPKILTETRNKIIQKFGGELPQFVKDWGSVINSRLSELYDNEEIKTDEDFATAYSEISMGLESIQ